MAEMTREEKIEEIARINRVLGQSVTEVREEDRTIKRDLVRLRERRDELMAETGGNDLSGPPPSANVRQIRMIGRKGY